jgi:hypothetical protein
LARAAPAIQYLIMFPTHILPIFGFLGLIVGLFFSNTVGAVLSLVSALLAFSHMSILSIYLFTGHYSWITGVLSYLVFIIATFILSVIDFILACQEPIEIKESL